MRESNFAFPTQNKACVCITSQLYDKRALDTNSPLPLFNSLTHLTYLTSTSPRIREIMTTDGGLERLVRILHDFCMCPPPPENPAQLYGLSPANAPPPKLTPTLNPQSFDKHAAYRFSLAFQCVVNIGVRGSEPIRSRVVQAGTLEVVGCILEAWLANKGFAVGPSASASGMPRESREQRLARRQAQSEARQREQVAQLQRALQRQLAERTRIDDISDVVQEVQEDESMEVEPATAESRPGSSRDIDTSTETSSNVTPAGNNTPTGTVTVPGRDRSGTIIARPVWDPTPTASGSTSHHHRRTHRIATRLTVPPPTSGQPSTANSTDTSRPETETEDDGDIEMDDSTREGGAISGGSTPEHRGRSPDAAAATVRTTATHSRRAVGIVSDTPPTTATNPSLDMNGDAHIIINDQTVAVEGVGVEDGIVSLDTNDDFAMGAPPGAPGAINGPPVDPHGTAGEQTPRAGTVNLPGGGIPIRIPPVPSTTAIRVTGPDGAATTTTGTARRANAPTTAPNGATGRHHHHHHHHHHDADSGPYRDEDVLLSLQLLAYLSKYPHVRQAFYKPRPCFHPASLNQSPSEVRYPGPSSSRAPYANTAAAAQGTAPKESNPFIRAFNNATGRGKDKEKATAVASDMSSSSSSSTVSGAPVNPPRMTNVFALVERFTYRPSSSELDSPNPPPTLPPDIQYWAGVIMRNACRKDDSRGGIRQCANMMCGKWESFPREFAKCRRCRKAKYCGKECQSTAWSEGHRFWCSAKDPEEDTERPAEGESGTRARTNTAVPGADVNVGTTEGANFLTTAGGTVTGRTERRAERERERAARAFVALGPNTIVPGGIAPAARLGRSTITTNIAPGSPAATAPNPQDASRWAAYLQQRRTTRARDEAGANPQVRLADNTRMRRLEDMAAAALDGDNVDPNVRRQILQLLYGRQAVQGDAGPSRTQQREQGDGDDDMVL